jgi:hypothetical protein
MFPNNRSNEGAAIAYLIQCHPKMMDFTIIDGNPEAPILAKQTPQYL